MDTMQRLGEAMQQNGKDLDEIKSLVRQINRRLGMLVGSVPTAEDLANDIRDSARMLRECVKNTQRNPTAPVENYTAALVALAEAQEIIQGAVDDMDDAADGAGVSYTHAASNTAPMLD